MQHPRQHHAIPHQAHGTHTRHREKSADRKSACTLVSIYERMVFDNRDVICCRDRINRLVRLIPRNVLWPSKSALEKSPITDAFRSSVTVQTTLMEIQNQRFAQPDIGCFHDKPTRFCCCGDNADNPYSASFLKSVGFESMNSSASARASRSFSVNTWSSALPSV